MTLPSVPVPFVYNAQVISVHDGDSIWVEIDRGMYDYTRSAIRLVGCNAIELANPGGPEARDNLAALLPAGTRIVLATVKPDKYGGRLDAQVTYLVAGQPHDLVTDLAAGQWVALWDGNGPRPVPPWPRTV